MSFILYHTLGCHLCELAEAVISDFNETGLSKPVLFKKVDIASSAQLMETYGVRIPVLCHEESQKTLDWPFDVQKLADFVIAPKK